MLYYVERRNVLQNLYTGEDAHLVTILKKKKKTTYKSISFNIWKYSSKILITSEVSISNYK